MNETDDPDIAPEYPAELIARGVRGKYADAFHEASNVVLIDDDLHESFPDSKSVNDALRALLSLRARESGPR